MVKVGWLTLPDGTAEPGAGMDTAAFGEAAKQATEKAGEAASGGGGEGVGQLVDRLEGFNRDVPDPLMKVAKTLLKTGDAPSIEALTEEYPVGESGGYLIRAFYRALEVEEVGDNPPVIADLISAAVSKVKA